MTWKHLLVVAAGFILLVSFSDKANYSAYEPNDIGYSMHKSASELRVSGGDALRSKSHSGI